MRPTKRLSNSTSCSAQLVPVEPPVVERLRVEPLMASMAYKNTPCTDTTNSTFPATYLPLRATAGVQGVWVVISPVESASPLIEHRMFLETAASVLAIALERVRAVKPLQVARA